MPIREYICGTSKGCAYCRSGFEQLEKANQPVLTKCPRCGGPVTRRISVPRLTRGQSSMDDRAKAAGFHKLKRLGKGEYEKQY